MMDKKHKRFMGRRTIIHNVQGAMKRAIEKIRLLSRFKEFAK
jgi:hypothetical protein